MKYFVSDLYLDNSVRMADKLASVFPSAANWTEAMLDGINSVMGKKDVLYILGNFASSELAKWRRKIKRGDIWLIKGDHDPSDSECRKAFGNNFRHVLEIEVCGVSCWLSHYPHAYWPKSHYGALHLYGHCHGQREADFDRMMPQRRSVKVCPEVICNITGRWQPISAAEICCFLLTKNGHDPIECCTPIISDHIQPQLLANP